MLDTFLCLVLSDPRRPNIAFGIWMGLVNGSMLALQKHTRANQLEYNHGIRFNDDDYDDVETSTE